MMLSLYNLTVLARRVMFAMKRVGLRDDPWGTPQMIFLDSEVNCGSWILWVLLVRYEVIHLRASTWIPIWWSLLIKM